MFFTTQLKTSTCLIPRHFLSVLLLLLFVLTSEGCSSSEESTEESTEDTAENTNAALKITVVDNKGLPIEGVDVSSQSYVIESSQYNALNQLILDIPFYPSPGVIKLSKQGYLDGVVFLEGVEFDLNRNVTLLSRGPVITFDGSLGGKFASKDGATIDIPSSSLVDSNGDIVFGPVDLYITPLDISDAIEADAFPGSFSGVPTNQTEAELLYSYGVVEYSFFQNGEELQLLNGTQAEIELPIYASQHFFDVAISAGDTIPLWTLDESTGVWIQEGMGTVVENVYSPTGLALRASTTHFSWFNADRISGLTGGTPDPDPDNEGPCNLLVLFEGLLDNSGYELFINVNRPGYPLSTSTLSFVYSDPQSVATSIPRNVPLSVFVEGPARRAEDGRIVTSQSLPKDAVCAPGLEEVIITLSLTETEPEFVRWNVGSEPVFTLDSNGLYQIASNKVLMGGLFTGTDQVEVSAEIVGFPLSLPNNQFFEAEYQKAPIHSNPTTITATISNGLGIDQRETSLPFIDNVPPIVLYTIAYNRAETSDTLIRWWVEGADAMRITYIDNVGNRVLLSAESTIPPDIGEMVVDSIYPNGGSIEFEVANTLNADQPVNTVPVFPPNFGETD